MPPTVALAPVQPTEMTGALARHYHVAPFRGRCNSTVSARSPCGSSTARPWQAARFCAIRLSSNVDLPVLVWPTTYRCRRRVSGSSITNATGFTYNVPHYPGVGRDWRSEMLNPIVPWSKKPIPKSSGEWTVHLRPSRAAAAKPAKPLSDVALEPYAHEISGLRRRRDAARAPQCGLETQ